VTEFALAPARGAEAAWQTPLPAPFEGITVVDVGGSVASAGRLCSDRAGTYQPSGVRSIL